MSWKTFIGAGVGVWLLVAPFATDAQFAAIVTDPVNLVQNTLQAVRSLISNANEVQLIQQNVISLANEARQLVSLPLSLVQQIDQAITSYTQLMNQGRGLAFQVQASVQQFENLYQQATTAGNGTFLQRAERMLGQIREAGRLGVQVSAVYERLCQQQTRVGQLMAASQAAVGTLQVEQASAQLLGVITEQQISIQQLLATSERLKLSETMRQLVLEEQAAAQWAAFTQGLTVVPIRGLGEGRGLPEP